MLLRADFSVTHACFPSWSLMAFSCRIHRRWDLAGIIYTPSDAADMDGRMLGCALVRLNPKSLANNTSKFAADLAANNSANMGLMYQTEAN